MKTFLLMMLAVVLITPVQGAVFSSAAPAAATVALAAENDLYAYFDSTHIAFYEERVAKEPVVSQLSDRRLSRMAAENGVSCDKMEKVLVLQHALQSQGKYYTTKEILNLTSGELVVLGIDYIKYLKTTMSEEEFQSIVADFKKISNVKF